MNVRNKTLKGEFVQELIGDDPSLRLYLIFTAAMGVGTIGLFMTGLGMLSGLIHIMCWIQGKPLKLPEGETTTFEMLSRGLGMFALGWGTAVVIHAVAMLYQDKEDKEDKTP